MTTPPTKTEYEVDDELDLTGLVVTATYTDETTKTVEISKLIVSGFDNNVVGEQEITVTYEGKTATFIVKVVAEEPEVISGISVAARTLSINGDKITVGEVTGGDKEYAVTVTGTGVLETVTSVPQGEGLWFGLQLSPTDVTDITKLEYKTAIQNEFTTLTEADATEAGVDGQIVWWINENKAKTQDIWLKYANEDNATAIKLSVSFVPYEEEVEEPEVIDESKAYVSDQAALEDALNSETVTVNNVTTLGNEFGGIEVSQGKGVTSEAKLVITGTSSHNEDVHIWTIGEEAKVTVVDSEPKQYKSGADTREDKEGYVNFILATEDRPVPHTLEAAATEAIKPSWTIEPFEPVGEEATLPDEVVNVDYKVTIKTEYEGKADWSARIKERTVTTYFTIPEGVTVWYPVWNGTTLTYVSGTNNEVAYGMEGHPLSAENIEAEGIVYVDLGNTEITAFNITIKLVDGEWDDVVYGTQTFYIEIQVDPIAEAKAAFLEAATSYNPASDIYDYSFNRTDLTIDFDFAGLDLAGITQAVMSAAGDFLDAVFDENNGNASEVVINMNGQEITLTSGNEIDNIVALAAAVFNVELGEDGNYDADDLYGAVEAFVVANEGDGVVTADFTMTVTNQEDVTFALENLTATFNNVTGAGGD